MDEFGILIRHFENSDWPAIEKVAADNRAAEATKGRLDQHMTYFGSDDFLKFQEDYQHTLDEAAAAKNIAAVAAFLGPLSKQITQPLDATVSLDALIKPPAKVERPWPEYTEALDSLQKSTKTLRDQFHDKTSKLLDVQLTEKAAPVLKFENE